MLAFPLLAINSVDRYHKAHPPQKYRLYCRWLILLEFNCETSVGLWGDMCHGLQVQNTGHGCYDEDSKRSRLFEVQACMLQFHRLKGPVLGDLVLRSLECFNPFVRLHIFQRTAQS